MAEDLTERRNQFYSSILSCDKIPKYKCQSWCARMFFGYFLKEGTRNDLKPIFDLYTRVSSVFRDIWRKVLFSSNHLSSAVEEQVLISILPHFPTCFKTHCGCGKRYYLTSWIEGKGKWVGHVWREISAPIPCQHSGASGLFLRAKSDSYQRGLLWNETRKSILGIILWNPLFIPAVKGRKNQSKNTRSFTNGVRKAKKLCQYV